jgi:hypothetical protein
MKQLLNKILAKLKSINYILVAAWVIPAAVLLTILYLNFLPFGYEKTLTINVGSKNDDKGEFRLEPSPALGARQELDGKTFRYLDGLAYAVYEPKVVLNNATIKAELTASPGVSFILPPDLSDVKWDYDWNASNIEKDFEVEASEKDIYNAFLATPAQNIDNKYLAIGNDVFSTSSQFAIELHWKAGKFAQLLTGNINLYQNQKDIVLNYNGKILKYPLPDFFLGEERTAIIAFDGKKLYVTTDKNDTSTKLASIEIASTSISNINVYKSSAVSAWTLHTGKPKLIETKDDSIYLDGTKRLVMPNTADKFEDGPFTVYAEWTPEKAEDGQQIIGHYNWEIWQNEKTVSFQVGRMSSSTGPMLTISYSIGKEFFNKPHSLQAIYSPASTSTKDNLIVNGRIKLFVDGTFAGQEYFANEIIWKDYGNQNLSLGWTQHNYGKNPNFRGIINKLKFNISSPVDAIKSTCSKFSPNTYIIKIPFYGTGEFTKIRITTEK